MTEYVLKRVRDGEPNGAQSLFEGCKGVFFRETETGGDTLQPTEFFAAASEEYLYLRYVCGDAKIVANYTSYNDPLYTEDVCELFISFDGNPKRYTEYEFSPRGVLFAARISNDLNGKTACDFLSDSRAQIAAETYDGGYALTVRIPFSEIGRLTESASFNAYRVDVNDGDFQNLYALNPTGERNFHMPSAFVRLRREH